MESSDDDAGDFEVPTPRFNILKPRPLGAAKAAQQSVASRENAPQPAQSKLSAPAAPLTQHPQPRRPLQPHRLAQQAVQAAAQAAAPNAPVSAASAGAAVLAGAQLRDLAEQQLPPPGAGASDSSDDASDFEPETQVPGRRFTLIRRPTRGTPPTTAVTGAAAKTPASAPAAGGRRLPPRVTPPSAPPAPLAGSCGDTGTATEAPLQAVAFAPGAVASAVVPRAAAGAGPAAAAAPLHAAAAAAQSAGAAPAPAPLPAKRRALFSWRRDTQPEPEVNTTAEGAAAGAGAPAGAGAAAGVGAPAGPVPGTRRRLSLPPRARPAGTPPPSTSAPAPQQAPPGAEQAAPDQPARVPEDVGPGPSSSQPGQEPAADAGLTPGTGGTGGGTGGWARPFGALGATPPSARSDGNHTHAGNPSPEAPPTSGGRPRGLQSASPQTISAAINAAFKRQQPRVQSATPGGLGGGTGAGADPPPGPNGGTATATEPWPDVEEGPGPHDHGARGPAGTTGHHSAEQAADPGAWEQADSWAAAGSGGDGAGGCAWASGGVNGAGGAGGWADRGGAPGQHCDDDEEEDGEPPPSRRPRSMLVPGRRPGPAAPRQPAAHQPQWQPQDQDQAQQGPQPPQSPHWQPQEQWGQQHEWQDEPTWQEQPQRQQPRSGPGQGWSAPGGSGHCAANTGGSGPVNAGTGAYGSAGAYGGSGWGQPPAQVQAPPQGPAAGRPPAPAKPGQLPPKPAPERKPLPTIGSRAAASQVPARGSITAFLKPASQAPTAQASAQSGPAGAGLDAKRPRGRLSAPAPGLSFGLGGSTAAAAAGCGAGGGGPCPATIDLASDDEADGAYPGTGPAAVQGWRPPSQRQVAASGPPGPNGAAAAGLAVGGWAGQQGTGGGDANAELEDSDVELGLAPRAPKRRQTVVIEDEPEGRTEAAPPPAGVAGPSGRASAPAAAWLGGSSAAAAAAAPGPGWQPPRRQLPGAATASGPAQAPAQPQGPGPAAARTVANVDEEDVIEDSDDEAKPQPSGTLAGARGGAAGPLGAAGAARARLSLGEQPGLLRPLAGVAAVDARRRMSAPDQGQRAPIHAHPLFGQPTPPPPHPQPPQQPQQPAWQQQPQQQSWQQQQQQQQGWQQQQQQPHPQQQGWHHPQQQQQQQQGAGAAPWASPNQGQQAPQHRGGYSPLEPQPSPRPWQAPHQPPPYDRAPAQQQQPPPYHQQQPPYQPTPSYQQEPQRPHPSYQQHQAQQQTRPSQLQAQQEQLGQYRQQQQSQYQQAQQHTAQQQQAQTQQRMQDFFQPQRQAPGEDEPWWKLLPDFVPAAALAAGWDPRGDPRPEPVFVLYQKQFNGPANAAVAPMHKNTWYPPGGYNAGLAGSGAGAGPSGAYNGGGAGVAAGARSGPGGAGGGLGPDQELLEWARDVKEGKSKGGRGGRSRRAAGGAADAGGESGGGGTGHWITNRAGVRVYVENGVEYMGSEAYRRYKGGGGAGAGGSTGGSQRAKGKGKGRRFKKKGRGKAKAAGGWKKGSKRAARVPLLRAAAPSLAPLRPLRSASSRCRPFSSASSGQHSGGMADPREYETRNFDRSDQGRQRLHVHEGLLPSRAKGAVFDMDGTLLDTNDRRVESWQAACSKRGLKIDKETYMALTGMAGHNIVDKLCKDQGVELPPEEVEALVKEESKIFKEKGLPNSPAVSPVLDILDEAARRGLKLAVCSGGRKDAVERSLAERGLADRFQAVVTSADVQNCKPSPDIFCLAAEKLGLAPGDCVAYEDAEMGKRSAREAGYLAVIDVTSLGGHPENQEREGGERA
ncbi:hypothetical protein HYH03_004166 [Edaphochlamys debaryana]|uniref:Uncharacterized protein n=1 Tax=Edaphochlamys debaryana TaxID=47281 RepID=A0A835YBQ7_9CHLO|nr:hypothetical protein HYH03_004166 [Edaphochlamys debaryana]|eukprot:KAG2497901.1 hypothetical protein HYH03_004166 [Edaphochlamys debaryana]